MIENRIEHIYRKCLNDTATAEERREFIALIRLPENEQTAKTLLSASFQENNRDGYLDDLTADGMIEAILLADRQPAGSTPDLKPAASLSDSHYADYNDHPPIHRVHFLRKWGWAAAVAGIFATTAYFWTNSEKTDHQLASKRNTLQMDIAPGTNKAVLIVDNKTLDLSSGKQGIAVGDVITYSDGEKLSEAGKLLLLSTPRGGQYQLTLPDGSKVWLNAASSIRFPSRFNDAQRLVTVSGEAYFEIAKNKEKPFIIDIDGKSVVEVLGTSFNINSYSDENAIKTTLIDGKIKVSNAVASTGTAPLNRKALSIILTPGQQVEMSENSFTLNEDIEVDSEIAWKNGLFIFNNDDIKSVMRQVSRWYDVNVVYDNPSLNKRFVAEISRGLPISKVLRLLELTNDVHFKMDGKNIIVSK